MTNEEKTLKEELVKKLNRLSNHYALNEDQVSTIRTAADIISKDIKEISGMMAMQRKMIEELGERRVGEIAREVFLRGNNGEI